MRRLLPFLLLAGSSALAQTTGGGGPAGGGGSAGVASINSTTGAFTFTGAGVSCTTTTCTFSGGGGSGTVNAGTTGQLAYYAGAGTAVSGNTTSARVLLMGSTTTGATGSAADDGATTANALTYTGSAGVQSPIFVSTNVTNNQYWEGLFTGVPSGTAVAAHSVRISPKTDPGASGVDMDLINPTVNGIAGLQTATFATGAGAGTTPGTPACTASHICDSISGSIGLTTGTATPTTGIVLTVTTGVTRTNLPNCVAFANLTASPFTQVTIYPSYTTTTVVLNATGTALTASTAYTLRYFCGGV